MSAQFTISKPVFARALARIVDTAPNRAPKPILRNVRLTVNGHVTLDATDVERYHVETLNIPSQDHRGDLTVLCDARALRKVVTSCKAKTLIVHVEDDSVKIGNTTLEASSKTADDLPSGSADVDCLASITVDGSELARLIESTAFAADDESSRYALAGLLVETDGQGYLRLVGTDGRRLATDYVGQHVGELTTGLWVAKWAVKSLKAIKKAERCTLNISENEIRLICYGPDGTSAWIYRQIDGRFPKWRDVYPTDGGVVCDLAADDLLSACDDILAATAHLKDDENCSASVTVCCADDVLTMSSNHAKCFVAIDCVTQANRIREMNLDARYLQQFCKANKGRSIRWNALMEHCETRTNKQCDNAIRLETESADYIVMPLSK